MVQKPEDRKDISEGIQFSKTSTNRNQKYIEEYNSVRPHQTHGYETPDDVYQDIFENEIKQDTIQAA